MSKTDEQLWQELVDAHRTLMACRFVFFHHARDKIAVLCRALRGSERNTALRYLLEIDADDQKKPLIADLLRLASVTHSDTVLARNVILGMRDRPWLVATIRPLADEILSAGDDDQYLRIAELYDQLDDQLLKEHLARCRNHPNPHVRDIPDEYFSQDDGKATSGTQTAHESPH